MPGVWNETIDMHRREVREAIMLAGATLVSEHGLRSVTMSQIAERAGIGRATLYKYFPSVEAILLAWHERQVAGHVQQLTAIAEEAGADGPRERLEAVLEAYALIVQEYHGRATLYHVDLYRLEPAEVDDLGLDELVCGDGIVAIEWAERWRGRPDDVIEVALESIDDEQRLIRISDGKA